MKKIKLLYGGLLFLIMGFGLAINTNAQTFMQCEVSDEFTMWQEEYGENGDINFAPPYCQSIFDNAGLILGNAVFPATFRVALPNTTIRNQLKTETCWANAAMTSIESNLFRKRNCRVNLSPGHMELATQNSLFTPTRKNFDRKFNSGGSLMTAAAYLLNNWGPITESNRFKITTLMDVVEAKTSFTASEVESQKSVLSVHDVALFASDDGCNPQITNEIKKYLMDHGALVSTIFHPRTQTEMNQIMPGAHFYYSGDEDSNHAVTVIGWNDQIPAASFASTPSRNGAWIIQNSHGEESGDNGLLYVSYDDVNICSILSGYFNVDTKVSDNAYFYDDLGISSGYGSLTARTVTIANVFERKGSNQVIDRVTFGAQDVGLKYTIYYAPNNTKTDYEDNVLATGTITHVGYTSVLVKDRAIDTNHFSIIITFESDEPGIYLAAADKLPDTMWADAPITSGVSFYRSAGAWVDSSEEFGMNTIRVYTSLPGSNNVNNSLCPLGTGTTPTHPDVDREPDTNPATGFDSLHIQMMSILAISISGYGLLRRYKIFAKF